MAFRTKCQAALACALMMGAIAANAADDTLRVAAESSYAPFAFFDSKAKKPVGFEVDLLEEIAKDMGKKLEIVDMSFDAIIPSLLSGTADLGASSVTITPERQKRLLFSDPYYAVGLSILIRAESKDQIKDYPDLKGRTVCVQIGTSGAQKAESVPGTTLRTFNTVNEAYLELGNKGCEAVVTDRPVTAYYLTTIGKEAASKFVHIEGTESDDLFGFPAKKNNTALIEKVNASLKRMREDGTYAAIHRKWFGKDPE